MRGEEKGNLNSASPPKSIRNSSNRRKEGYFAKAGDLVVVYQEDTAQVELAAMEEDDSGAGYFSGAAMAERLEFNSDGCK